MRGTLSIPSAAHISQPTPPYLSTFLPYTLSYSFSFSFPRSSFSSLFISSLLLLQRRRRAPPAVRSIPSAIGRRGSNHTTTSFLIPEEFFCNSLREFRRVFSLVSVPFYLACMISPFSILFYSSSLLSSS